MFDPYKAELHFRNMTRPNYEYNATINTVKYCTRYTTYVHIRRGARVFSCAGLVNRLPSCRFEAGRALVKR